MLFCILLLLSLVDSLFVLSASVPCACGWRLRDKKTVFTHRIHNDFSQFSHREDLNRDWLVNGYSRRSDNVAIRQHQQFEVDNVKIEDGVLVLKQSGYSNDDWTTNKPVRVAGIQSRRVDILHGSFRTILKIEGDSGGSVGSLFWYHNDTSEIDIEAITRGTSIKNNTINYTSHPSTYPGGLPIPNATHSVSLDHDNILATYRQHRFDCSPDLGAQYFLDDSLVHQDSHSIPQSGGNFQLNLWADGNQLWSGLPSKTDVTMAVKMIEIYYNTSDSNNPSGNWREDCDMAGGPGPETVCLEGTTLKEDDPRTWERSTEGSHEPYDRTSHLPKNRTFAPSKNKSQLSRAAYQRGDLWGLVALWGSGVVLNYLY